jgi:Ser/Thr protein kinase RdoA (MazF antagonist)
MVPFSTKSGKYFVRNNQRDYWRMFNYLVETKSYDRVTSPLQAFEGGKAFGEFQYMLSDFDPSRIKEPISHFHDIENRLYKLRTSIKEDPFNRVNEVSDELEAIEVRCLSMNSISKKGRSGILPLRVVHGDTKFNNILLDSDDKAQCVIDLDTVMPGYVAYDFGDAIRTIINTASEDENDLDKIQTNLEFYRAFTEGYLKETMRFLTPAELESLPEGVLLFPYMQSVRFLTDYIMGDSYYKIDFEKHNLQRTRAQLQLLYRMENQFETLRSIVKQTAESLVNA